jgi:hypothetical protein
LFETFDALFSLGRRNEDTLFALLALLLGSDETDVAVAVLDAEGDRPEFPRLSCAGEENRQERKC